MIVECAVQLHWQVAFTVRVVFKRNNGGNVQNGWQFCKSGVAHQKVGPHRDGDIKVLLFFIPTPLRGFAVSREKKSGVQS